MDQEQEYQRFTVRWKKGIVKSAGFKKKILDNSGWQEATHLSLLLFCFPICFPLIYVIPVHISIKKNQINLFRHPVHVSVR